MTLAKVVATVVSTEKHAHYRGQKILEVQPIDENGKHNGAAVVAIDVARAGEGDLVIWEAGKEAAQANPNGWFNPADAAILGIIDSIDGAAGSVKPGAAGGRA